jgi:polyvinyl alcohol dehydrogenase (cytochrome)
MRRACTVALLVALSSAACANLGHLHRQPFDDAIGRWDWPTYGRSAQHTFSAPTTLTPAQAPTLAKAWEFPTGDAVTATPTVVHGTVYVGSWDGDFYALDLETGALRWKFQLDAQPAVQPQPGVDPRPFDSDGGLVTSSAWYEPGRHGNPDLVIFGGGYTLYALDAHTGGLVWKHAYTGRPDLPPDPAHDDTRIFSSPVVVDRKVIIGISADGDRPKRGYVVAASLETGDPVWTLETDVDATGTILNDGCGNVWSSGTVLPDLGLVVFDTADCHFQNPPPMSESIIALHVSDGTIAWQYQPPRHDALCDLDFGATLNAGVDRFGHTTFLGVGGKDGTYYSLDPRTGRQLWSTNVVFGGFSGGFIGTTAYDGHRVYGSTAIGDFGRFESNGPQVCDPSNPADTPIQEPSVHAFDAATGAIAYEVSNAASFAPTTVAGGMTFNGVAFDARIDVRDASSGSLITSVPLDVPSWGGIAVVGDALVLGTGTAPQGAPDGVVVFTPNGAPPQVPR